MIAAWRFFAVEVAGLRRLSTSFLRVTFAGDDLNVFADNGFDQRIKVVLPLPGVGVAHLPTGPDWYAQWRALPTERRNPIRTYTVRAVRSLSSEVSEVDVDFVMHPGGGGPAAVWAASASVGDKLALIGPDSRYEGSHGGLEFRPPDGVRSVLLAGDETAVPAISSIVERLPTDATGAAVLEVPHTDDFLALQAPTGIDVRWHARGTQRAGSLLVPAVTAAAERLLPRHDPAAALEEAEALPWEVPDEATANAGAYTWLAGEAGAVKALRRHLIGERGLDRRSVALMGYWRLGHAEPTD